MIDFEDPNWRSPATRSTASEILDQRERFRNSIRYVTGVMRKRYAIADEERRLMKQLEEEQKNDDDITAG